MAPSDRLLELLAGEAAGERLGDAEWRELEELLDALPPDARQRERDGMLEAAALAQAAFLAEDRANWSAMPADLRGRLESMGRARAADLPLRASGPVSRFGWGWIAAAAMTLMWLGTAVWLQQEPQVIESLPIQVAADARVLPWRSEIGGYQEVQGQITWSDSMQAGEMRFSGLPVNDPEVAQYQLWIVDPDRHENPVDGGVFDAAANGELVVAVQAKLPVSEPVAFAVTLEQTGGVVVSGGPLLLVASEGERPEATL